MTIDLEIGERSRDGAGTEQGRSRDGAGTERERSGDGAGTEQGRSRDVVRNLILR